MYPLTLHSPVYFKNSNRIAVQCATAKDFHVINSCLLAALWTISEAEALTANLKQGKTSHTSPPFPLTYLHFKKGHSLTPPYFSPIVFSPSFLSALQDNCSLLFRYAPPAPLPMQSSFHNFINDPAKKPKSKIDILSQFHTPDLPLLCHDEA